MDTNSKKSIDSSDADEEDLEIDDEEVEEFFESEERHMWREAYEQATSQYSDDFLTALTDPELLLRIMNTWEDLGLVGIKNKVTLALYCCLTKDFSQRVHNVWYGESRGGKTTPIEKMLKCFDPDVVEAYTRVTTTFIDHCEELTDGKIFYLNQFTQRDQNNKASEYLMGDEILDLLLSEGDRVLGTVVRNKPMRLRLHGKPLFISTTNYRPRITTSSRLQLTHANESLEQTEQIMWKKTEFYETGERPSDFSPFLMQFTHWFRENCKKQVKIPWARVLTLKLINLVRRNKALRWRDDIDRIFVWIKVDALIHQEQLPKTETGEIIASPQQWTNVLKLAGEDLVAIMEELSPAAQQIYKIILENFSEEDGWFSTKQIAPLVAFARSTITHSMAAIRNKGLLLAEQEKKRKPWRYKVMPTPEGLGGAASDLFGWTEEELAECLDGTVLRCAADTNATPLIHALDKPSVTTQDTAGLARKSKSGEVPVAAQHNPTQDSSDPNPPPSDRDLQRVIISLLSKEPREHKEMLIINRIRTKVSGVSVVRIQHLLQNLSFEGRIERPTSTTIRGNPNAL